MYTTTIKQQQRKDRKEIEDLTREFLAKGGQIKECEAFKRSDDDTYKPANAYEGMR